MWGCNSRLDSKVYSCVLLSCITTSNSCFPLAAQYKTDCTAHIQTHMSVNNLLDHFVLRRWEGMISLNCSVNTPAADSHKCVCVPSVTVQCQGQCHGTGWRCWPYRSSPSHPDGKTRRAAETHHSCPQPRCLGGSRDNNGDYDHKDASWGWQQKSLNFKINTMSFFVQICRSDPPSIPWTRINAHIESICPWVRHAWPLTSLKVGMFLQEAFLKTTKKTVGSSSLAKCLSSICVPGVV